MRLGGWQRWFRFNAVGAIGIVVQLGVLWSLTGFLRLHYFPATLIAVEVAILHNFLWHGRWTWQDRPAAGVAGRRLVRFNLTTGLVSLVGNLALMPLLVQAFRLSVLPANLFAIACCSLANFLLADRMVFGCKEQKSESWCTLLPAGDRMTRIVVRSSRDSRHGWTAGIREKHHRSRTCPVAPRAGGEQGRNQSGTLLGGGDRLHSGTGRRLF